MKETDVVVCMRCESVMEFDPNLQAVHCPCRDFPVTTEKVQDAAAENGVLHMQLEPDHRGHTTFWISIATAFFALGGLLVYLAGYPMIAGKIELVAFCLLAAAVVTSYLRL